MKKWNMTTLTWNGKKGCPGSPEHPFLTNISIEAPISEAKFKEYILQNLTINSLEESGCEACLCFRDPHPQKIYADLDSEELEPMKNRIAGLRKHFDLDFESIEDAEEISDSSLYVFVSFRNRKPFCENAVLLAQALFKVLGIEDLYQWKLAKFELTQTTYVKVGGEEIPYKLLLKRSLGLPVMPHEV